MSSLLLTTLDTGNTAWMIMATILVLLMSIPGIALFYGGLVRQKNILSILMQTVFIVAVVSLIWVAFGYSWAFSTEYANSGNPLACIIGGFDKCFLHGIGLDSIMPTGIPELTFAMFQCMFALITPALILGAFAERVKFNGYVLFTILWVIIAYLPMAHWVWGGGFLQEMGAIDFAGGTVV
uniref:ammonium transporter n=1 Tax=Segatella hominis TaxID=2518605 RepID=UPI004028B07F